MEIKTARDAQTFVAVWVAETMPGRRCEYLNPRRAIRGAVEGCSAALALMDAAPSRYTESTREDMREAIDVLRHGFHPYAEAR